MNSYDLSLAEYEIQKNIDFVLKNMEESGKLMRNGVSNSILWAPSRSRRLIYKIGCTSFNGRDRVLLDRIWA